VFVNREQSFCVFVWFCTAGCVEEVQTLKMMSSQRGDRRVMGCCFPVEWWSSSTPVVITTHLIVILFLLFRTRQQSNGICSVDGGEAEL
jgi:hypothetical protein